MIHIKKSNQIVYYIINNNEETIFHFGKVEVGQELVSGLDVLEQFHNEDNFLERLYVFNPDFVTQYQEIKNQENE